MDTRIKAILIETQSIQEGHFKLRSGMHSGIYCNIKKLSLIPEAIDEACRILSDELQKKVDLTTIDVVVGPAIGAIIPAFLVAGYINKLFNFSEKADGAMKFRDSSNIEGKNVLVIEDVVTTGSAIYQTIEAVKSAGGNVTLVAVIADRSGGKVDFGVPLISAIELDMPAYEAGECPICREGIIPIYTPGSKN